MNNFINYAELVKPTWAPPSWLFGPVWTVLYVIIILSFGRVFIMAFQKTIPFMVALPFILNIIFNIAFTPLQFGLKNNILAAIDILFVLGTLVWALVAIYPHARAITFWNLPYLIWVCFATTVQLSITYLNYK